MEGWPSAALSWFKCISRTTEGANGEHSWGGVPCPGLTVWTLTYPTLLLCASFTQLNLPAKFWTRRTAPVLLAAFTSLLGESPCYGSTVTFPGSRSSRLSSDRAILKCTHLVHCSWDDLEAEWTVATVLGHTELLGPSGGGKRKQLL